jgi:hypothetical protein
MHQAGGDMRASREDGQRELDSLAVALLCAARTKKVSMRTSIVGRRARRQHHRAHRRRPFSTQAPRLVREFISDVLYDAKTGYFARDPIKCPAQPLAFTKMLGRADYEKALRSLYAEHEQGHWLTPVEIFQPWYSQAIASWLVETRVPTEPVRVVEIGGGNGTNAGHILDYLQLQRPDVYETCRYTIAEISPSLAQKQRARLARHGDKVDVRVQSFLEWRSAAECCCAVIALEVLDNLPHDKVVTGSNSPRDPTAWKQVHVCSDAETGELSEATSAMTDALIVEAARWFCVPRVEPALPFTWRPEELLRRAVLRNLQRQRENREVARDASKQAAFVPTGAIQLMHVLRDAFPRHRLLVADFDQLPPSNAPRDANLPGALEGCINAPIVSSQTSLGARADHASYLLKNQSADVFFATDFHALARAYQGICAKSHVSVLKSSEFCRRYAAVAMTTTRSGYNPLLEDFANTRFMLSN